MLRRLFQITNLRIAVFIFVVLAPVGAAFWLQPRIDGDGAEYLLMQESFKNHGSPEFTEQDRKSYGELIQRKSLYSGSTQGWYDNLLTKNIEAGDLQAGGYVRCEDGAYRSFHFCAYSLSSLPFRILCGLLGIDPVNSFGMLHALLLSMAILMIVRSRRFNDWERIGLAAGLLLTCTVFYFDWIHPELFSTTFLAMAIILFLDRKTASALVCAAIASLQNQPIALTLPIFYLAHGLLVTSGRPVILRLLFPFTRWRSWALTVIAALIVLLPSFYYLRYYGHPNPIADLGGLSSRWITFSRLFSLWFDINQGIVMGYPGLLAGVVILLPIACFFGTKETLIDLADALWLVILSLAISIPCLTQGNWNAGCAIMTRYGIWIGIPLLFTVALLLRRVRNPFRSVILVSVVLLQLWVPTYCGYPARTFYMNLNPLSVWVINRFPQLYNPDPEIFAERLSCEENVMYEQYRFIWKSNGRVKKILLRNHPLDVSNFWNQQEFYRELSPASIVRMRDGWSYLNGDFQILQSSELVIRYDDTDAEWLHWSVVEPGFRWSLGKESTIRFSLPMEEGKALSGLMRVRMRSSENDQYVEIYLNGKKLFGRTILGFEELTLQFEPDWILRNEPNELVFKVPNAIKPPPNGDIRILGVRFEDMIFQTISDE